MGSIAPQGKHGAEPAMAMVSAVTAVGEGSGAGRVLAEKARWFIGQLEHVLLPGGADDE
jgi:hypothetical protein